MSFLVITVNYEVVPEKRDEYLALMDEVRVNADRLGVVQFALLEDDARANLFTEMVIYDGWVQYDRARMTPPTHEMTAVFAQLEDCIVGGSESADVRHMNSRIGRW